jgi:phosphoadenosine phosphosulfate reductase
MNKIENINKLIERKTEIEAISVLAEAFPAQVVFSTSLGYEDQVITHFIFSNNLPVTVFTLDTGRLFKETLEVLSETENYYQNKIKLFSPIEREVKKLEVEKGLSSFYESIENRKECCYIRKVEPLKRALAGNKIWITGIRSEQSTARNAMQNIEWDEVNQIVKFHPILNWTFSEVKNFVAANSVPYNKLHDRGFVSIGCEPCTRAIKPGEDFRAGRWWWENNTAKECGLHLK